jgi:hypothetical protein
LTWSLLTNPPGVTLTSNGIFSCCPTMAQSPSTNPVLLRVSDNGVPSLSATQSFAVSVNRPVTPQMASATMTNGLFAFEVMGDFGPDYTVLMSPDLTNWTALSTNSSPPMPFLWFDPESGTDAMRFYRIKLGP